MKTIKKGDFVESPITHKSNTDSDKNPIFDRYFTKGKRYLVLEVYPEGYLDFLLCDDTGKLCKSTIKESSFINFNDWIIVNEL